MLSTSWRIPRLMVAGAASGAGKTTLTSALAAFWRARGLRVACFKVGPDYLDPTYHRRATGRDSHTLDGWMMGREAVLATFARAAADADLALIEGMMGLYDGAAPGDDAGTTAEVARWLSAPVVLGVDASGMAGSLAALARGYAAFDPRIDVVGVLPCFVGSPGHLDLLRRACAAADAPPVLGGLPRRDALAFPERHLGLVTARTGARAGQVDAWAALVPDWIDSEALLALARSAPPLDAPAPLAGPARIAPRARIGLADDDALHFYYPHNLRLLEEAGAELVRFSPLVDALPERLDGLLLGGGYPEAHAPTLAANSALLGGLRTFAGPIYAECGGLMLMARAIRTTDGALHPMAGRLPGVAVMHDALQALGYVEVETTRETLLGPAGTRFRGHQFRTSTLELDDAAAMADQRAYAMTRAYDGARFEEGYHPAGPGELLASYTHAHWGRTPALARAFVARCATPRGR